MSENKERPSMQDIIDTWKVKHGYRFYQREDQLKELYSNFKHYGYNGEDVNSNIKRIIVDAMHLSSWPTAKKWRAAVEEDLELVHQSFWPKVVLVDHNPEHVTMEVMRGEYEALKAELTSELNKVEEELLDLERLRKERSDIQPYDMDEDGLLEELGVKKDGRRE